MQLGKNKNDIYERIINNIWFYKFKLVGKYIYYYNTVKNVNVFSSKRG